MVQSRQHCAVDERGGMPKFKIHAVQNMAIDFEVSAIDAEAADAAITYLLAMSTVVFVPIEPKMAPRYVRGLRRHWELEIMPQRRLHSRFRNRPFAWVVRFCSS